MKIHKLVNTTLVAIAASYILSCTRGFALGSGHLLKPVHRTQKQVDDSSWTDYSHHLSPDHVWVDPKALRAIRSSRAGRPSTRGRANWEVYLT